MKQKPIAVCPVCGDILCGSHRDCYCSTCGDCYELTTPAQPEKGEDG